MEMSSRACIARYARSAHTCRTVRPTSLATWASAGNVTYSQSDVTGSCREVTDSWTKAADTVRSN
eukprot:1222048-Rhodomonas_salina.1